MNLNESKSDFKIREYANASWLHTNNRLENISFEIKQLENENLTLKQLISHMRQENQNLRKRLFSAGKVDISKDKCA